ncbi:MAG TPA: aspartate aminotransferase family protein [Candidatus Dormibacteraeota bacterium]|jgi:4-aminobutyrate aminotransferase-like enzyme|nr:aspartate aminotransferase family protein [Candidatus Dormibacteraeota bacterium]
MAATAPVPDTIRRLGGGGPRRIAENAGLVITHGEGAHLVDTEGRRYLDFATAMGVAAIGHGNPRWTAALSEQAGRLAACVLHTPEHAEYLEALAEVLPAGLDRTALYSGGTEAVEVAVRLAQSVTGRRHLVSFTTGFHGKSTGVRFTGHRHSDERSWLGVDWVHDVPYPICTEHDALSYLDCEGDGTDALHGLEEYAAGIEEGVAAVIVEPVLGTAGNLPPERHFLRSLRDLCTRRGWLLILDESITGFGRLGTVFAAGWYEVRPDILILGKAIGGGYPLSGVAAGGELWDNSLFAEPSATSSSYGANPVACAAGRAVLDVVTGEGFLENVRATGTRLAGGLRSLEAESPYVSATRGVGLMLGFDLVDPDTGALASPELSQRLFLSCLQRGLLVAQVPRVRLNAPLTLRPDEADAALEALASALSPAAIRG